MAVSAYHVISTEKITSLDTILDTHVCINNPYWQSSGCLIECLNQ